MDSFTVLVLLAYEFWDGSFMFWLWMRSYHQFSSKVWIEHVHEHMVLSRVQQHNWRMGIQSTTLGIEAIAVRIGGPELPGILWGQLPMFLRIACRSHLGSLGPHLEEMGLRPCWFGDIP